MKEIQKNRSKNQFIIGLSIYQLQQQISIQQKIDSKYMDSGLKSIDECVSQYVSQDQKKPDVFIQLEQLLQKIQIKDKSNPSYSQKIPLYQLKSTKNRYDNNLSTSHSINYEKIKDQPYYKELLEEINNLKRQNQALINQNKVLRQHNVFQTNKNILLTQQITNKQAQYDQIKRSYDQMMKGVKNLSNSTEYQPRRQQQFRRKLQDQKRQLQKEIKQKKQKDDKINELLDTLSRVKLQNIHLMGSNQQVQELNKKIASLMARNSILQSKAVGKTETVRHLWEIKQIQYNNILYLLNKYRK